MIDKIVCVDLETTGEMPPDGAVVEIGWTTLAARQRDLAGLPFDWQLADGPSNFLVDPGRPILPEASAVHHLLAEDIVGAARWEDICREPIGFANPATMAIAAFGAEHERAFMKDVTGNIPWLCVYKGALRHWPDAPRHSNQVLRYWKNPVGMDRVHATPAHRAGSDAYVTAFLLRDMLNDGVTVEQLIQWTGEPALLPRCYIGEYRKDGKGTPWSEVEEGYLNWILTKDFKEDVVHTVKVELERREKEMEREKEQHEMSYEDDV